MLLNLSPSQFRKDLSSPPSLCSETFCSDYRSFCFSCLSASFFHLTYLLLFCRKAQFVIAQSRYCWQGVTFRWGCTMAFAGHLSSLSSSDHGEIFCTSMCHLCCHCWAVVKSPELKINQFANIQMSWSLISKWLGLRSTFPRAQLLCFEIISLDFDTLLSEIIKLYCSIKCLGLVAPVTNNKATESWTEIIAFITITLHTLLRNLYILGVCFDLCEIIIIKKKNSSRRPHRHLTSWRVSIVSRCLVPSVIWALLALLHAVIRITKQLVSLAC